MIDDIDFLLVTCSMEQSRHDILVKVVENLKKEAPEIIDRITVFDNASKVKETSLLLTAQFPNIYVSDKNIGYWSAIKWWLDNIQTKKYTYIIESDMMHYNFKKIYDCKEYLDANCDIGSVRLHEYSVVDKHLYDKEKPTADSKKYIWQSHTNRVTNKKIEFLKNDNGIWKTTFLTQLMSLNRSTAIKNAFSKLEEFDKFCELDFQKLYWQQYQYTGILDKGIFVYANESAWGGSSITGSWTNKNTLEKIGYQETRNSKIINSTSYTCKKL
jgi:hypothetical protein